MIGKPLLELTSENQNRRAASRIPRREVVNADWLIKLRWVAVTGQFLTILAVNSILNIRIELISLGTILSVTAVSNFFVEIWYRKFLKHHADEMQSSEINLILGLVMTLDLLSLTALLYCTGGPTNPFNFFFFVNLSLSAFVLNRSWTWSLNLVSIMCFGLLLYSHVQVPILNIGESFQPIRLSGFVSLPQGGTLIAFATCSSVIVYFINRLNNEVGYQEKFLREAEAREAQTDKLQALGTLAAGTAHELSTPLSTISIVINEAEQLLQTESVSNELLEDVALIKKELERCRNILSKMSADVGQTTGESLQSVSVKEFAEYVITELPVNLKYRMQLGDEDAQEMFSAPLRALALAIGGIITNAFDAQFESDNDQVDFSLLVNFENNRRALVWVIQDCGTGMTPDVLKRVREPFFTTKEPGKGMGLGVFLAHSTIDRLGGKLKYHSESGKGTTATITLPMDD
ncbi:ATP-binding protein [bacterium]|nr:ATP-binding protein [bacterium]